MIIGLDVFQKFGIERSQELVSIIETFLNNSNLNFPENPNVQLTDIVLKFKVDGEALFITKSLEEDNPQNN